VREIKFRGIPIDSDKFIYGYYHYLTNSGTHCIDVPMADFSNSTLWHVKAETVGQFTGLCDRQGKEIYEGDIIDVHPISDDSFTCRVVGKHIIKWWNGQFVFKANSKEKDDYINFGWWVRSNDNKPQLKQIEVIGNIYEEGNNGSEKAGSQNK